MPNTVLNPQIIASTAVRILENELVMGSRVYRGYEEEFDKKVNGYEVGDTISIRKPQQFSVRQTAVAVLQDVQEGKLSLVVNQQKGVDFRFSGAELTLKIEQLAERMSCGTAIWSSRSAPRANMANDEIGASAPTAGWPTQFGMR